MCDDFAGNAGQFPRPLFTKRDAHTVMGEIALQMKLCAKAWVGYGQGRVVIIKDDYKRQTSYYIYEEGVFTFYDGRGGMQQVKIEEITEIGGY